MVKNKMQELMHVYSTSQIKGLMDHLRKESIKKLSDNDVNKVLELLMS